MSLQDNLLSFAQNFSSTSSSQPGSQATSLPRPTKRRRSPESTGRADGREEVSQQTGATPKRTALNKLSATEFLKSATSVQMNVVLKAYRVPVLEYSYCSTTTQNLRVSLWFSL